MARIDRREFMKRSALVGTSGMLGVSASGARAGSRATPLKREFNRSYSHEHLNHIAFPIGGIGAGMVCLEGTGCLSHISVRNTPNIFHEPFMFGAVSVKGFAKAAKILEGPVPSRKIFGAPGTGNGAGQSSYGFPRFESCAFEARFPFAGVKLYDDDVPLKAEITGWSPFIPGDADRSSLPVGALEYRFTNPTTRPLQAVFSYHAFNFMQIEIPSEWGGRYHEGGSVKVMDNGFILSQPCLPGHPHFQGDFALFTPLPHTRVDYSLFRGGWFDSRTIMWKDIAEGNTPHDRPTSDTAGASLYVPFTLAPGQEIVIPLLFAWYVPKSEIRHGESPNDRDVEALIEACRNSPDCCTDDYASLFYQPWYSGKFKDIGHVTQYWTSNYDQLKSDTQIFTDAFYSQTLPDEVLEAVAANLTILKSPTVLRQKDGRLWAWEGCHDLGGCCHGSCTHVWNYAQAICHLFPELERSLRETEYKENQDSRGHQTFRSALPIRVVDHGFHAAADGQLGGIMKLYRDWRISGDTDWLRSLWPMARQSMDYCIRQWDPKEKGVLEEPHHNTYDIEFWGPEGMGTSFYLGALTAMISMGVALDQDTRRYKNLLERGKAFMESELFNGEYYDHKVVWEGLQTPSPLEQQQESWNINYSPEALELLRKEGPKYQYGTGCLSDGVLGSWIAAMCGLDEVLDPEQVKSHLLAVYRYNLKTDLSDHVNPQRPAYACGNEGGLLLCTWPKGDQPTLPFVYSNEVWTGIEYQVASHLMLMGEVEKGLDIVHETRKRYDGRVRNPFNEYECGHWYARAMASYGMIRALSGVRYDAVDQTLYIDSRLGANIRAFLSTESGFAVAGLQHGEPFIDVKYGEIPIQKWVIAGKVKGSS